MGNNEDKDDDLIETKSEKDVDIVIGTDDDDDDEDEYRGGIRRLIFGFLLFIFIALFLFVSIGALIKYEIINTEVAKDYINKISNKISGKDLVPSDEVMNDYEDVTTPTVDLDSTTTHTSTSEQLGLTFTYSKDESTSTYTIDIKEDYKVEDIFSENTSILVYSEDLCLLYSVDYDSTASSYTAKEIHKTEDILNNPESTYVTGLFTINSISYDRGQLIANVLSGSEATAQDIRPYLDKYEFEDYTLFAKDNQLSLQAKYNDKKHEYEYSISDAFSKLKPESTDGEANLSDMIYCSIGMDNIAIDKEYYEQQLPMEDELLVYYNSDTSEWSVLPLDNISELGEAADTTDTSIALFDDVIKSYLVRIREESSIKLGVYDSNGALSELINVSYMLTEGNKKDADAYKDYSDSIKSAYAELDSTEWGNVTYGTLKYNSTDTYSILTGYSEPSVNLTIPAKVLGVPVKEIASKAFTGMTELTTLTINGSEFIREYAFESCTNLTEVKIEDGLKGIENDTFADCTALSITIPDSVTFISQKAFDLNTTTIICNPGSYAEDFAKRLNVKYQLLTVKEDTDDSSSSASPKSTASTTTNDDTEAQDNSSELQ